MIQKLEALLSAWIRWYRFRRSIIFGARGLLIGAAVGLTAGVVLVFLNKILEDEFVGVMLATPLVLLLGGILFALLWPIRKLSAAQMFDRIFGLKERVSTALEINTGVIPDHLQYTSKQLNNTIEAANKVQPRKQLPIPIPWRELLLTVVLGLAAWLVILNAGPYFQATRQIRAIQTAVDEQIEAIEELIEEIENNDQLTAEQKGELTAMLEETIAQLEAAETLENAVAALDEAQEQLESIAENNNTQPQVENLQETGEQLSQNEGSPLQDFAENLANGNLEEAANDLENIDVSELTPEEAEQLASDLQQAAEALQAENPELADQLQQAADNIQNGDPAGAEGALQQASETLSDTAQQAAQADAAQQAASQLSEGQSDLVQAGQNPNAGEAQQANTDGQGQQGQGEGEGQGEGDGQGEGQSGQGENGASGAGDGEFSGPPGAGDPSDGGEITQNNNPDGSGFTTYEPIEVPQFIEGEGGAVVTLPKSEGAPGDVILGEGDTSSGTDTPVTVPYLDVFPQYEQAMRDAIDSGEIPIFLRPLIREYFSSLEP